jgi:phage terminase large subunit
MKGSRVHEPDRNLLEGDVKEPTKAVEEITGYKWKDNEKEDRPEKARDHAMDALRYVVHTLDARGSMSREEMDEWAYTVNEYF